MASPAYCLFCFETLSSHFEGSDIPPLSQVEKSWQAYQRAIGAISAVSGTENVDAEDMEIDDDDDEDEDGEESDDEDIDQDEIVETDDEPTTSQSNSTPSTNPRSTLQLPSITRLQTSASPLSSSASSSTSASISTSTSTPSSSTTSGLTTPLTASQNPSYSSILRTKAAEPSYPIFVTWSTHSSRSNHKHLRGCIGTFEALPISKGLETYALTSALDDQRFNPIPSSLLPQLSCSITLLADFTPCDHPLDWELGVHGIRISFTSRSGTRRYGATYLPDVAVEQGWSKTETLESLMRKAGWEPPSSFSTTNRLSSSSNTPVGVARRLIRGTSTSSPTTANDADSPPKPQAWWDLVSDFRTIRYTGLKASATYAEWRDWKRWVEQNSSSFSSIKASDSKGSSPRGWGFGKVRR